MSREITDFKSQPKISHQEKNYHNGHQSHFGSAVNTVYFKSGLNDYSFNLFVVGAGKFLCVYIFFIV